MDSLVADIGCLVLGAAQWGMAYGIANKNGQPAPSEISAMAAFAHAHGVHIIDTARAYGSSEKTIGSAGLADAGWRVITKLSPDVAACADPQALTDASVQTSLQALRVSMLDTLLLHRWDHYGIANGRIWRTLGKWHQRGKIRQLGISALEPADAWAALRTPDIQVIQVASNLLDQRLSREDFFALAHTAGKEIFVRSVFLQGVAVMEPHELPPRLAQLRPVLADIHAWERSYQMARGEAFLQYARALQHTRIIVGCETLDQVQQNVGMFSRPGLSNAQLRELTCLIPPLPDDILNPARW